MSLRFLVDTTVVQLNINKSVKNHCSEDDFRRLVVCIGLCHFILLFHLVWTLDQAGT